MPPSRRAGQPAEPSYSDISAQIEATFAKSGLEADSTKTKAMSDADAAVRWATIRLACLSLLQVSPPRRRKGRAEIKKEQRHLIAALGAASESLKGISPSLLEFMADPDAQRGAWMYVTDLAAKLSSFATIVREIDIKGDVEVAKRGRPPKKMSSNVARIVIETYEAITGRSADLPSKYGKSTGLLPLTREIFKLLEIESDPKAAVTAALKTPLIRKHTPAKPSAHGAKGSSNELFERMRLTAGAALDPKVWRKNRPTAGE